MIYFAIPANGVSHRLFKIRGQSRPFFDSLFLCTCGSPFFDAEYNIGARGNEAYQ